MDLFYLGLILALLLIAVVGMGYLLHGENPAVKRRRKPRHRLRKSRRTRRSIQE